MSTFVRFLVAVTLMATVAACGHDSAPTTPSAAPAASSTSAPRAVNGATISGSVTGAQEAHRDDNRGANRGPGADNQGPGDNGDNDDNDNNDNNDDDHDAEHNDAVEVNGTIAAGSLTGACASNSLSFRVGSTLVHTSASTQFRDTSCAALKAGDSVEVKGSRQADAAVLASRVEKRK